MNTSLVSISGTTINRDADGRYCLNDLWRASGEHVKNRPATWLQNKVTIEIAKELEIDGIPSIVKKQGLGTYVALELVYAYAMWISPSFHVKVIRTFHQTQTQPQPQAQPTEPQGPVHLRGHAIRQDPLGRYCLNDIWLVAGRNPRHKPANFTRHAQTQDLATAIRRGGYPALYQQKGHGTYAVAEIVYAYTIWISADLYAEAIQAFGKPNAAPARFERPAEPDSYPPEVDRRAFALSHQAYQNYRAAMLADLNAGRIDGPLDDWLPRDHGAQAVGILCEQAYALGRSADYMRAEAQRLANLFNVPIQH